MQTRCIMACIETQIERTTVDSTLASLRRTRESDSFGPAKKFHLVTGFQARGEELAWSQLRARDPKETRENSRRGFREYFIRDRISENADLPLAPIFNHGRKSVWETSTPSISRADRTRYWRGKVEILTTVNFTPLQIFIILSSTAVTCYCCECRAAITPSIMLWWGVMYTCQVDSCAME